MKLIELNKLFDISYGTKLDANKTIKAEKNPILYVTRQVANYGIKNIVEKKMNIKPNPEMTISVPLGGEGRLTAYLHFSKYYNAQNVAVLNPRKEMTVNELLYYVICIRKNQYKYSAFGREANETLPYLLIPTLDSIPLYVNKIAENEFKLSNFDLSKDINKHIEEINKVPKKEFNVLDLFDVESGTTVSITQMNKLDSGEVAVVSSSEKNNGINSYVDLKGSQVKIHKKGACTLAKNGSVGSFFYQESPIVTTSDVIVLRYKFGELNERLALYYKIQIEKNKMNVNYGRKINEERMKQMNLFVPVTGKGYPDHYKIEELFADYI